MRSFRRKHHRSERVMAHLREADGVLSAGRTIAGVCRTPAIREQTDHRWRNSFWGDEGGCDEVPEEDGGVGRMGGAGNCAGGLQGGLWHWGVCTV